MSKILLLCVSAASLLQAQNFPSTLPSDASLLVASNDAVAVLTANVASTDLTIPVDKTTNFAVYNVVRIGAEFVKICSVGTTTLIVCAGGRGFDGSLKASHVRGDIAKVVDSAAYHNSLRFALKSLASALGQDFNRIIYRTTSSTVELEGTGAIDAQASTFTDSSASYTPAMTGWWLFVWECKEAVQVAYLSPTVLNLDAPFSCSVTGSTKYRIVQPVVIRGSDHKLGTVYLDARCLDHETVLTNIDPVTADVQMVFDHAVTSGVCFVRR